MIINKKKKLELDNYIEELNRQIRVKSDEVEKRNREILLLNNRINELSLELDSLKKQIDNNITVEEKIDNTIIEKYSALFNTIVNSKNVINNRLNVFDKKLDMFDNVLNMSKNIINSINNTYFLLNNMHNENKRSSIFNHEMLLLDKKSDSYNILLCGYYGAPNLGDELMLETLLDYFKKINNISITIMLSNNLEYNIFKYDQNLHFIHYPVTRIDYDFLSDYYDTVVFGGGALIDDKDYNIQYNNSEMSLSTTLIELSKKMILKSKEVFWIGLSSSKIIKNEQFINNLKYIFNNSSNNIYLRDKNSLNTLKEINIPTDKVKIIDDIILSNTLLEKKYEIINKKKQIGVIPICIDSLIDKKTNELIISTIAEKFGSDYTISLIPFYEYDHTDSNSLTEIKEELNSKNIKVEKYADNFSKIIKIINNCDYIISMRYHGSLLAMALNKPVLSIVLDNHNHYYNKMNYIYDEYSKSKNILYLNDLNKETLNKDLDILVNQKKNNFNKKIITNSIKRMDDIINKIISNKK